MGYYTTFYLKMSDKSKDILDKLDEIAGSDVDTEYLVTTGGTLAHWYDHENDMLELSSEYPDVLFTLYGAGESGEHWVCYFKNGKVQSEIGEVTYPQFNPEKLK